MISYLAGEFIDFVSGKAIIKTAGVGYGVFLSETDLGKLKRGEKVELFIYTHVREDLLDLYGFSDKKQLELFELLISVSGVGPKSALLVVGRGVEPVRSAISKADVSFFTTIPRLGKKTAQRIIIDLKSKLGSLKELELGEETGETQEALDALRALGFSKEEAIKALQKMPEDMLSLERKVSFALKNLGSAKQRN